MTILNSIFAALIFLPIASQACGGANYRWLDIYVDASGDVSRNVPAEVSPTGETIHDQFYLRNVSEIVALVAGTGLEVPTSLVTVELLEQKSDTYLRDGHLLKGVFASVYKVTKSAAPSVEYVKMGNNYVGDGAFTRGCGGIQIETDRSKIKLDDHP